MRTKIQKILYIFSLIVGILLNASADVYKLKVTDKEQKIREENINLRKQPNFWVTDGIPNIISTYIGTNAMKFVAIDKNTGSIVNDWIDSGKIDDQKYRNPRKIYFKKGSGEVVIYLKEITNPEDRRAVAKQQFENILKCGLLNKNKSTFNDKIFAQQFNGQNWQMPGIAVKVAHNRNENAVMCSMKISRPSDCNANDFFQEKDWENLFSKTPPTKAFGNYEHTERQLMFSMLHKSINLTKTNNNKLRFSNQQKTKRTPVVPSENDSFFVWTKGNPCISIDDLVDNGGYCCAVWYKHIIKDLLKGAKMHLYYGEKSGVSKDIQVRLCGRAKNNKSNCYPNHKNFERIAGLVDIFSVDSMDATKEDSEAFYAVLQKYNHSENAKIPFDIIDYNMFYLKNIINTDYLCCCIIGQNAHCISTTHDDPIKILNTWMGNGSNIEYRQW